MIISQMLKCPYRFFRGNCIVFLYRDFFYNLDALQTPFVNVDCQLINSELHVDLFATVPAYSLA